MDSLDFLMAAVSVGGGLIAVWLSMMALEGGAPADSEFAQSSGIAAAAHRQRRR
jgi:hypothetical protein